MESCDRMSIDRSAESLPIKTLEELLKWSPESSSGLPGTVPLPSRNSWSESANQRRTLLCHDMQGGYLSDRFTNGCSVPAHDSYIFYHWSSIHAFIYFSHNFVTIPPTGWINAAHRNRVPIFGTLITEWDDGKAIWAIMLSDDDILRKVAKLLVEIADYYNFDGWLINVENSIEPKDVDKVTMFLRLLRQGSRTRPQRAHTIIWYDSVTIKGDLKWQNCLNDENSKFFHAVDGIFLNYNWTFDHLIKSKETAGPFRPYDIFVGVDVFGRGCYGGGGWSTDKALQVIQEHDMSVAIFAPGWVFECNDRSSFFENQNKFWQSLDPYLPQHKIYDLPLFTTFCAGYGNAKFIRGERNVLEEENKFWINLNKQCVQPSWSNCTRIIDTSTHNPFNPIIRFCHNDAWEGGGCLQILSPANSRAFKISLFSADVLLDRPLHVTMTVKCSDLFSTSVALGLKLKCPERIEVLKLMCTSEKSTTSDGEDLLEIYPSAISGAAGEMTWKTYYFSVVENTKNAVLEEILVFVPANAGFSDVNILLGELNIDGV